MFGAKSRAKRAQRRAAAEWGSDEYPPLDPSGAQDVHTTPLVFVHGLYGSTLVTASGQKKYMTFAQALGLRCAYLKLPMEWDEAAGCQESDGLIPESPVYDVGPFSIYSPFLDWAETCGRPFYSFAYDWRRSGNEAAEKLFAFLKHIHAVAKGRKIQLIGHSNGGIVIMAMFNRFRPYTLVHSVVAAGSPFRGGCSLLQKIQYGAQMGKNYKLLRPSVVCTFPSFYSYFLPAEESDIVDEHGQRLCLDLYDPATWRDHRFGLFQDVWRPRFVKDKYFRFLEKALPDAKAFGELGMKFVKGVVYPPIKCIASREHDTGSGLVYKDTITIPGTEHVVPNPFGRLTFFPEKDKGDGLVGAIHAQPRGSHADTYWTPNKHLELLNDIDLVVKSLADCFTRREFTLDL